MGSGLKQRIQKPLVKPSLARKKAKREAAKLGRALLEDKVEAVVLYHRKEWDLAELLQHLATQVKDLKRKQCKPHTKCLFKAREVIDKKYLGR